MTVDREWLRHLAQDSQPLIQPQGHQRAKLHSTTAEVSAAHIGTGMLDAQIITTSGNDLNPKPAAGSLSGRTQDPDDRWTCITQDHSIQDLCPRPNMGEEQIKGRRSLRLSQIASMCPANTL